MAETKVTRIKASDDTSSKEKQLPAKKAPKQPKQKKGFFKPFKAIAEYFKGAWYELKQVRWPNRGATWSLTLAVLAFTVFVGVLIVLLDLLFNYLFDLAIN